LASAAAKGLPDLTAADERHFTFAEIVEKWPRWPRAKVRAIAEARLAYRELLATPGPYNWPPAVAFAAEEYLGECRRRKVPVLRHLYLANFLRGGKWADYPEREADRECDEAEGNPLARARLMADREREAARRAAWERKSALGALQARRAAADEELARAAERAAAAD
jgi:hypothetical protein